MEPLVTNRRVLTWMCIYPPEKSAKWQTKISYIMFSLVIIFIIWSLIIASLTYILEYMTLDFGKALFAALQFCAGIELMYTILFAFNLRHKIVHIFERLSHICDAYANDDSYRFLSLANNRSEWIWKFFLKFIMAGFLLNNVILSIGSIVFCWLAYGNFNPAHLYHPYRVSLPWNQNTPLGYIAMTFYGVIFGSAYLFGHGVFLLLFISLCWYHQDFSEIFRHLTSKLDCADQSLNRKQFFVDIVEFHNMAKNFFAETAEVYSPFILVQLISGMIILAVSVFHLDLQLKHFDFDCTLILMAALVGISNLFIYCFFGKLATESYAKMTDYLMETNWYEYPNNLQKYLVVMVANTQRPIVYHGSNIAILDLRTFTKMMRATYTFYMMFKTATY